MKFSWMKKICIPIQFSLKFVPKGPIDNKSSLVEVMVIHGTPWPSLRLQMLKHLMVPGHRWKQCWPLKLNLFSISSLTISDFEISWYVVAHRVLKQAILTPSIEISQVARSTKLLMGFSHLISRRIDNCVSSSNAVWMRFKHPVCRCIYYLNHTVNNLVEPVTTCIYPVDILSQVKLVLSTTFAIHWPIHILIGRLYLYSTLLSSSSHFKNWISPRYDFCESVWGG